MREYFVAVTTQAQEHIFGYASYISNKLQNPIAAENFVKGIWQELATLNSMPQRFSCLDEEPWKTMGVRKMVYKEHLVYFLIDDKKAEVSVVGVVLGKRDQNVQLSQMNFE